MSKMNWDPVRWENQAARQGSEWASSDGVPPHVSGRGLECANRHAFEQPINSQIEEEEKQQKLTIRLYKALGESWILEAASLAADMYGECLHYIEHAKREKTEK